MCAFFVAYLCSGSCCPSVAGGCREETGTRKQQLEQGSRWECVADVAPMFRRKREGENRKHKHKMTEIF
uniref:Putative secreted protein n=1 Tax=Anopheles marajoara TaxID=58244 RepID=A0A2M4CEW2_9DIPT